MGRHDWHWNEETGKLGRGLATKDELHGLLRELTSSGHAAELLDTLKDQLDVLQTKELPMLKGKGFIVVDPARPSFGGEEYEQLEDAQDAANNVAYTSPAGLAIVYAPIAVLRPKREVAISEPSKLLKQLQEKKVIAAESGG